MWGFLLCGLDPHFLPSPFIFMGIIWPPWYASLFTVCERVSNFSLLPSSLAVLSFFPSPPPFLYVCKGSSVELFDYTSHPPHSVCTSCMFFFVYLLLPYCTATAIPLRPCLGVCGCGGVLHRIH